MESTEISLLSDTEGDESGVSSDSLKRAGNTESQSQMIEGMYGVEERQHHQPQKRLKLDDDHAKRFSISIRDSAPQGSSTILGGYMKEDSGVSAPPPTSAVTTPADTIDLTLGKLTLRG